MCDVAGQPRGDVRSDSITHTCTNGRLPPQERLKKKKKEKRYKFFPRRYRRMEPIPKSSTGKAGRIKAVTHASRGPKEACLTPGWETPKRKGQSFVRKQLDQADAQAKNEEGNSFHGITASGAGAAGPKRAADLSCRYTGTSVLSKILLGGGAKDGAWADPRRRARGVRGDHLRRQVLELGSHAAEVRGGT